MKKFLVLAVALFIVGCATSSMHHSTKACSHSSHHYMHHDMNASMHHHGHHHGMHHHHDANASCPCEHK
ncbi:hypothetical protein [Campylobacter majalis]|uniref:hypothetical protein n=1 Tax=Campylobacter majalis TaxID=2790656 RepID=UPI003D6997D5